jgi:adenylosuccinate synthase
MRRAVQLNSISGFCLTKLDVLDGLEEVKICTGYKLPSGEVVELPPLSAEDYDAVEPVYESMPGWSKPTIGATKHSDLPTEALAFIKRLEVLLETPVDIISTGPDRIETITLRHPFSV